MIIAVLPLTLVLLLGASRPALADTSVTVNTVKDELDPNDHACSLREALAYAGGAFTDAECARGPASGTTTIHVPAGDYLLGDPLFVDGNTVIAGAGAASTHINGQQRSQVLIVNGAAHAAISAITVTGGLSPTMCVSQVCGTGEGKAGQPGGGIVNTGTLTLTNVIVTGNRTAAGASDCAPTVSSCKGGNGGDGGGISNSGTLTIQSSTITGNATGAGGSGTAGQNASDTAPARQGGASGNGGNGGGISNSGLLTISNTTITGNFTGAGADGASTGDLLPRHNGDGLAGVSGGAGGSGAGIENVGRLIMTGSTVAQNITGGGGHGGKGGSMDSQNAIGTGGRGGQAGASGSGAGIDTTTETTISNSTIVGNVIGPPGVPGSGGVPSGGTGQAALPSNGAGMLQEAMGSTLTHVTVALNRGANTGGGIDGGGGSISTANSIVASNTAATGGNCAGVVTDLAGNVEFGSSSCPAGFLRSDPKLGPLSDNGGPTPTVALLAGSAAIHHVRACVLTTDQRGVARPVGAACDSGAYQFAPPSLSSVSGTGTTTSAGTVTASVNPNLKATTVVVNYGPTAKYGLTTSPLHLAASASTSPVTVPVPGLTPGTTYHFDVVATNGDGTATSSDFVFRTLPPLAASIASASTTGSTLSLTVACAGGFGPGTCAGQVSLTSRVTSRVKHGRKTKRVTRTVTVGAGSYAVATGRHTQLKIRLNRAGQKQLTAHYVLATTLTVHGPNAVVQKVTFRYPVIRAKVDYDFNINGPTSVTNQLTVSAIPRGGKVRLACRGGGCPFGTRTFSPRRGTVGLAPALKSSPLHVGTVLEIDILAPNRVGEVAMLTIRTGQRPSVARLCLPPGAGRPARCV